ncbi:hypothetical protein ATCC90586_011430 [Pythium insidiosum]|nr:hypothetical protein ATCC90586_011430 [Pythium insidiosum]
MADRERAPWVELAQFDKARYQREFALLMQRVDATPETEHATAKLQRRGDAPEQATPAPKPALQAAADLLQPRRAKNEPRQPDTAYTFFWKSVRPEVIVEQPELSAPMVSREVGRRWRALSREERQR